MRILILLLLVVSTNSCALFNKEKVVAYMQRKIDKKGAPNIGTVPDYADLKYWASSPFKIDSGDFVPNNLKKPSSTLEADVFFVHPTTYISSNGNTYNLGDLGKNPFKGIKILQKSPWNANIDDVAVNLSTDTLSIANQATAFNASCRVFAPRYRQANIKAFLISDESANAAESFDIAYQDIKKAFQYYLDHHNEGRPIFIAAHSQGARHAARLLQELFDGKPLQNKLVCAYLAGYKIPVDLFKNIPTGTSPNQTGCVVGWQSFNADATFTEVELNMYGNTIGVNPITWTIDKGKSATAKKAEVLVPGSGQRASLVEAEISATIDDYGLLMVKTPSSFKDWLKDANNFHVWDYNLFWMSIRTNVADRLAAFNRE